MRKIISSKFNMSTERIIFALNPQAVQVGDVVLTSRSGLLPAAIRGVGGAQYSHAALVTRPGMLLEAVPGGVLRRAVAGVCVTREEWIQVLRCRDPLPQHVNGASLATVAEMLFSDTYDYVGAAASKFRWLGMVRARGTYCSELIAVAFEQCGRPLSTTLPPSNMGPGDLYSPLIFDDVSDLCTRRLSSIKDGQAFGSVNRLYRASEPRDEIRLLQRTFRRLRNSLSIKVLPQNLRSTAHLLSWLSRQTPGNLGVAKADRIIANVLLYGGYTSYFGREAVSIGDAALILKINNSAADRQGEALDGDELLFLRELQDSMISTRAALLANVDAVLEFQSHLNATGFRTFELLLELYKKRQASSARAVIVFNEVITGLKARQT